MWFHHYELKLHAREVVGMCDFERMTSDFKKKKILCHDVKFEAIWVMGYNASRLPSVVWHHLTFLPNSRSLHYLIEISFRDTV
jgi:hypothetical protein